MRNAQGVFIHLIARTSNTKWSSPSCDLAKAHINVQLLRIHAMVSMISFIALSLSILLCFADLQVCGDPVFCTRVLEGRFVPGLAQLSERDPAPGDADLGKVNKTSFQVKRVPKYVYSVPLLIEKQCSVSV